MQQVQTSNIKPLKDSSNLVANTDDLRLKIMLTTISLIQNLQSSYNETRKNFLSARKNYTLKHEQLIQAMGKSSGYVVAACDLASVSLAVFGKTNIATPMQAYVAAVHANAEALSKTAENIKGSYTAYGQMQQTYAQGDLNSLQTEQDLMKQAFQEKNSLKQELQSNLDKILSQMNTAQLKASGG